MVKRQDNVKVVVPEKSNNVFLDIQHFTIAYSAVCWDVWRLFVSCSFFVLGSLQENASFKSRSAFSTENRLITVLYGQL
jgi:hypothetical protein